MTFHSSARCHGEASWSLVHVCNPGFIAMWTNQVWNLNGDKSLCLCNSLVWDPLGLMRYSVNSQVLFCHPVLDATVFGSCTLATKVSVQLGCLENQEVDGDGHTHVMLLHKPCVQLFFNMTNSQTRIQVHGQWRHSSSFKSNTQLWQVSDATFDLVWLHTSFSCQLLERCLC